MVTVKDWYGDNPRYNQSGKSHKLKKLGKSYLLLDFLAFKMKYWLSDSQTNPIRKIGIDRKWSEVIKTDLKMIKSD